MNRKQIIGIGIILVLVIWIITSYNSLVDSEILVEQNWGNVTTRYQERADKIDQLVKVVKGSANFEKSTLTEITEARASVGKVELKADQITPENLEKFEAAQNRLKGTFDRLMVVVEKYPELKTTENFGKLQDEVAGMENRIATARTDFNAAVASYNSRVRRFPSNIFANLFDFQKKEMFKNQEGTENRPDIDFSDKPASSNP